MNIQKNFLHKNGLVTINLARELILMEEGDKINTIDNYSKKYNVGRGTIQSVIKHLENEGAINLERRGHLGTFLIYINYKKLWEFTNYKTIVGVMPLPYSKLYQGLSTGLNVVLGKNDFSVAMAYMRGAETRIESLKYGRYDFAITSKLAADQILKENDDMKVILELGENTYVNKHVLVYGQGEKIEIKDGIKVGVDKTSRDQYYLSIKEFEGVDVEFIDMSYNQIVTKILNKEIDAAVWSIDEIEEKEILLSYRDLKNHKSKDSNTAVIIINNNNNGFDQLIEKLVKPSEVRDIQQKVIQEKITPKY
ncbi:GntR family transcriptional regulator YhfZ [Paraclostridium dentum]|uniref:GntR family transcriptional regulator YhfZ n=1 Tax=Paraclostridium dentum TaxID=2662455 RepID=UPI003B00609B